MKVTKETFPKEWDPLLLSELVEKADITLDRGEVISSVTMASNPGNYPVYSSSAKNNGLMGFWGNYQIDEELITWSIDGGGYLFYRPKHKFSVTNVCGMLRANKNKFNIRYLHYLLEWQHSLMTFDYVDKAHPSVIRKRYLIPTIGKSEQDSITTILSTLDRAIASTEQLIAKYQHIKTGLLHDLLTRGIDKHGNLRNEKTHQFKDSKLGRIPVEWEVRKIEDVCTHIVDCPHSTPNYLNHGILIARTFSVKDGVYDINNSSYISEAEYHDRIQRLEPKPGDILFTREAPVGESFVIPKKMKICLGQRVMLLRLELNYNPRYLLEVLYSRSTKLRFDNIVGGTTNPHLNVGDVKKFEFVFPRLDEQNKIDVCISSIRKFIDNNNINLTKLQSLKAGLMQDLLSGKVRVKI